MYRIFRLPPAQADKVNLLMADDIVSRQSVTVRDAKSLGLEGEDRYILVEGSEAALSRASELVKDSAPLKGAEAEDVYRQFRSQDDQAVSGMGLIFGP